ncbi:hypothetical protein ZWY2020_050759 [Hordeum vulgare]|nr:hypothetical protein ZWY2020_050759 [Hordeum vulgare]
MATARAVVASMTLACALTTLAILAAILFTLLLLVAGALQLRVPTGYAVVDCAPPLPRTTAPLPSSTASCRSWPRCPQLPRRRGSRPFAPTAPRRSPAASAWAAPRRGSASGASCRPPRTSPGAARAGAPASGGARDASWPTPTATLPLRTSDVVSFGEDAFPAVFSFGEDTSYHNCYDTQALVLPLPNSWRLQPSSC